MEVYLLPIFLFKLFQIFFTFDYFAFCTAWEFGGLFHKFPNPTLVILMKNMSYSVQDLLAFISF